MSYAIRIAAVAGLLVALAPPASAQSYGYGAPAPPPPPPPPGYPPPPGPGYPPPPAYGPPPGSRCEARYAGAYRHRRFVCPMRVAKPVGAPCRCVADPAPGYPPGPPIHGRVIP